MPKPPPVFHGETLEHLLARPPLRACCEAEGESEYRRGYLDGFMAAIRACEEKPKSDPWLYLWGYIDSLLHPWCDKGQKKRASRQEAPPVIDWETMPKKTRYVRPGYVYLLTTPNSGKIKIGHGIKPLKRLRALQSGNPDAMELLREIPHGNPGTLERRLHKRYAAYKVRREWFALPPEVLALLLNENFD